MRKIVSVLALAGAMAFFAAPATAGCGDARFEAVRDQILAACPCTGNHGQYVSCVAHAVRDAVREGRLDTNCKGRVVRCSARSTCGKKDEFVTCTVCVPGTCTDGKCDDPAATLCVTSSTCPQVVGKCSTKSSSELCVAKGGIAGEGSCCHASCVP